MPVQAAAGEALVAASAGAPVVMTAAIVMVAGQLITPTHPVVHGEMEVADIQVGMGTTWQRRHAPLPEEMQ